MGRKPIKIWGDGVATYFDLEGRGVEEFDLERGGSTRLYFDLGIGYNFDWEGWGAKEHTFFAVQIILSTMYDLWHFYDMCFFA